jgi:hypothetical protein
LKLETLDPALVDAAFKAANIDDLVNLVSSWISGDSQNGYSLVAALCSKECFDIVSKILNPAFTNHFRLLLYTSSLAHVHWDKAYFFQDISVRDLQGISYIAGYELLNKLDGMLAAHRLTRAPKEVSQSLFIAVFGALIAVQYSTRVPSNDEMAPDTQNEAQYGLWNAMKEHVERMLRHYTMLLAKRVQIVMPADAHPRLAFATLASTPAPKFVWYTKEIPRSLTIRSEATLWRAQGWGLEPLHRPSWRWLVKPWVVKLWDVLPRVAPMQSESIWNITGPLLVPETWEQMQMWEPLDDTITVPNTTDVDQADENRNEIVNACII